MDARSFEALVVAAVESLPEEIKQKLENVGVVIEDEPTAEHKKAGGSNEDGYLMGLYQGVPLSKRMHYYGNVLPDKITIFKNNIERVCRTDDDIKEAVRRTVIHEFAHHFGISDEHMKNSGTY
ncbi:MAG: metallopeptidase family protein [Candidatus Omnitrophica bacterium]|nr:metallopeptidase family protein [Candidatus Omnitrophota bacterium]MDD5311091.1 metallopeptidase family protein [Candidatus Omnitrophota bacterium]MDD5546415.1 metallopeptidase family protein [Candidatus Omnitrophota bacterium]